MESTTKKVLVVAAVIAAGSIIYGLNKASETAEIFDKMDIEPEWFDNLKISLSKKQLSFDLDVRLTNKSGYDLNLTGLNVAKVKQINVFYDNNLLAIADVNITSIEVPAKNQLIIKNIPVVSNASTLLENAAALLDFDFNKVSTTAKIEVLGVTYMIGEE